jgi:hypothetical protein
MVINNSVLKEAEGPQNKMIRIEAQVSHTKKIRRGESCTMAVIHNTREASINDASAEVLAIIAR